MLVLWTTFAQAGDAWIGGGLVAEGAFDASSQGFTSGIEGEVDARFESGPLFARLDYDLKLDLTSRTLANLGTRVGGVPLPEWAMVQIAGEGPRLRLGIVNPSIGLEDWDDRLNYLPTTSASFDWGVGRVAGLDAGWQLTDGPDLFVYGGYDLDYESLVFGVGALFEGDAWGYWSGFAAYPQLQQYELIPSAEWYLGDTTLSFDSVIGLKEGHPFVTTETLVNLWPDGPVSPVARVEVNGDPDGTLDAPDDGYFVPVGSASIGVNFWPMRVKHADDVRVADAIKVQLEGRLFQPTTRSGQGTYPGVFLSVTLWRPEPDPFTARYEE